MRFIFIAACLCNLRRAYARGFAASTADAVFGREQFNSTGGTCTRVGTSFAGAHDPKLSVFDGAPRLDGRKRVSLVAHPLYE